MKTLLDMNAAEKFLVNLLASKGPQPISKVVHGLIDNCKGLMPGHPCDATKTLVWDGVVVFEHNAYALTEAGYRLAGCERVA